MEDEKHEAQYVYTAVVELACEKHGTHEVGLWPFVAGAYEEAKAQVVESVTAEGGVVVAVDIEQHYSLN